MANKEFDKRVKEIQQATGSGKGRAMVEAHKQMANEQAKKGSK
jgi:hypothetical protein